MFKKIRIGLLPRIVIAIALAIALGGVMPIAGLRFFATFSSIFGNFLQFVIPLIIIGLIVPAIADIGRSAGFLLGLTVLIAYVDGALAGFFAYFTSEAVFPSLIPAQATVAAKDVGVAVEPFFTIKMPPLFDVVSSLVLAFVLGLGMAYTPSQTLRNFFSEFRRIIAGLIRRAIIPLLPLYIFCIFLAMTYSGESMRVLRVFMGIIGVIFAMHVVWLMIEFCIAGAVAKKNPLRLLWGMVPAYATALGTSSSAATIPVTLQQTLKNGVSESVAAFVVPLCATIHMPGSILKITSCAVALMLMQGMPFDVEMFTAFILSLGIMAIAAPGVPGGTIMAALAILSSILGFKEADQALMIALYIVMDSFGTAGNVTGDGAVALIVDKIRLRKDAARYHISKS